MKKILFYSILSGFMTMAFAETPRSSAALGSGGGGAASSDVGEVSFLNPASIVHVKGSHFYTGFQHDLWSVSLIENDKQSVLPGALSYFKAKNTDMISMSFAQFVYRTVSVGASAAYWQVEDKALHKRYSTYNANVGVTWTPDEHFGAAFVTQNIAPQPDEFKRFNLLEPTSRFGINYLFDEWFRWRLDFVTLENNDWSNWVPQTGIETYVSKWLILRTGVSRPPGLKESWSAGFGLDLPRFKLDYASQWHVEGTNEQRHSVDLGVPF